jgi:hypothetical protein
VSVFGVFLATGGTAASAAVRVEFAERLVISATKRRGFVIEFEVLSGRG